MEPAGQGNIRASPELPEDGYEWRKYGQKNSMCGKTTSYFRCRRRNVAGCTAKKQAEWYPGGQPGGDHRVHVVYTGIHTLACSPYNLRTQVFGDHLPPYDPSQQTGDQ